MAATTAGAIKARLESLGTSVPFFRDGPRTGQECPFGVITEAVAITLDTTANGDFGDPSAGISIIETATVDIVQNARSKTGATTKNAERYGLVELFAHALHGHGLPAHPAKVTAVRATEIDRFPISDNRTRSSIKVQIHRELLAEEVTPS